MLRISWLMSVMGFGGLPVPEGAFRAAPASCTGAARPQVTRRASPYARHPGPRVRRRGHRPRR